MNLNQIALRVANEEEPKYPSLEYFKAKIDSRWHPALEKAWNWKPRIKNSRALTPRESMKLVKAGKKALAYGWQEDYLREYAEKFGLESDGISAYLPENEDLAELMRVIGKGGDDIDNVNRDDHFLRGIILGFPHDDVFEFCEGYGI